MFRTMLTPTLVKILYVLGAIGILVFTILWSPYRQSALMQIGLFIVAEIFWRVICEFIIVIFSIHEELVRANRGKEKDRTKERDLAAPSAALWTPSMALEKEEAQLAKEKEEDLYSVFIKEYTNQKILINAFRKIQGYGLWYEVKDIISNPSKAVKENISKADAEEWKKQLEEAGAVVVLKKNE